jgi:hypothetical protein
MFGRRSHQRFTISAPSEGVLQTLRDVLIERIDRDYLVVMSRHAGIAGEILMLELPQAEGTQLEVVVADSRPIMADGAVRHRLTLNPVRPEVVPPTVPSVTSEATHGPGAALAVLTHRLPVRILNCSSAGCLLDSWVRLEKATIGSLRLEIDGREFVEDIQVVRCQAVQGSSSYHVGVEFLWIVPPREQSLRRTINFAGGAQVQRLGI